MQTGQTETRFFDQLRAPEPDPPWSSATVAFFIGAYILLWIAALSMISVLAGDTAGSLSEGSRIFATILHSVAISVVTLQWASRRLPNGLRDLALQPRTGRALITCFLIGFGAAVTIDLTGRLLRLTEGQFVPPLFEALRLDPNESISLLWIVAALTATVVQPIVEGLIFAGVIYPRFRSQVRDNLIAIASTAITFTFIQVIIAVEQGTWYVVVQPLLMGVFIAGTRAFTKNTRLAIAARIGFGLWLVLSALFSVRF